MSTRLSLIVCPLVCLALGVAAYGQETTYEDGPNGVKFKVTRQVVERSIPVTEYQTREQKFYRPQVTTEYQTFEQNYAVPITEYRWVARQRGWWNPFAQPYWTYELQPVTRWETRPAKVQVPVARTDWVEETRTTQVPVTTYRTAAAEYISKEPVLAPQSPTAPSTTSATSLANRPESSGFGGQSMDKGDPPREPSRWYDRPGSEGYRR